MKKLTQELEGTPIIVKEQTNSNSLIDKTPLEGTPFTLVQVEQGNFLAIGNQRVTELTKTEDELMERVITGTIDGNVDWDLIVNTINAIIELKKTN